MPTILVVDDDPKILSVLGRGLRFEGYQVQLAADGNEALHLARMEPADIVVLDVMLPGIDGLEVCRRLRRGTNIPILMLTARDAVSDRIAGLDSGADDYLIKPFDFDERDHALLDSFEIVYPPERQKSNVLRINAPMTDSRRIAAGIYARRVFKATPALSARRD